MHWRTSMQSCNGPVRIFWTKSGICWSQDNVFQKYALRRVEYPTELESLFRFLISENPRKEKNKKKLTSFNQVSSFCTFSFIVWAGRVRVLRYVFNMGTFIGQVGNENNKNLWKLQGYGRIIGWLSSSLLLEPALSKDKYLQVTHSKYLINDYLFSFWMCQNQFEQERQ